MGAAPVIVAPVPNYDVYNEYVVFNDGPVAINGVTIGGSVGGSAPRSTVNVGIGNGSNGPWTCTTTLFLWSCNGNLTGEPVFSNGDNLPDPVLANTGDKVTLQVTVSGNAVAGNTVDWGPTTISCTTPGACTSGTVSPANSDGSVLNQVTVSQAL
jgi:hypothetical protein